MDRTPRTSSGSDYSDALKAVMDHAAEAEAAQERASGPPAPPLLTRGPVMAGLAVAFVGVVAWNVVVWSPPAEPLPPTEARASLNVGALAAQQAVEQYREEHGVLPSSLQELGFPEELRIEATRDGYRIVGEGGGASVVLGGDESPEALLRQLVEGR